MRPAVIIGGYLSAPESYRNIVAQLSRPPYQRPAYIVPISVGDWLQIGDSNFRPLLDKVAATVEQACLVHDAEQVDLIGHSAGGRLARAYLGDLPYQGVVYSGHKLVRSLTTLGTAHFTKERWVVQFSSFVQDNYPGSFYPRVRYRSVAGDSIQGRRWGSPPEALAYRSYEQVCGQGAVAGDGVVPVSACYLAGADNLVLRGVRHGPYINRLTWYGAPDALVHWAEDIND